MCIDTYLLDQFIFIEIADEVKNKKIIINRLISVLNRGKIKNDAYCYY